jgi:hypothetical protein
MKKERAFIKSGISGIVLFALVALYLVVSKLLEGSQIAMGYYSLISNIAFFIVSLIFFSGFYYLGKRYDSRFLRVVSLLSLLFIVLAFLFNLFFVSPQMINFRNSFQTSFSNQLSSMGVEASTLTDSQIQIVVMAEIIPQYTSLFYVLLLYVVTYLVLSILLGIALIKVGKKAGLALASGILEIVGACTVILFGLGLLVNFAAFICEIVLFFKEDKKK